ncbi:unnamed protein product [Boreogadus saida]
MFCLGKETGRPSGADYRQDPLRTGGLVDITDFPQWPREDPHARTTHADTARTTRTASLTASPTASPTGVTSPSRDETGPAGETIPLDTTVAHGVTV